MAGHIHPPHQLRLLRERSRRADLTAGQTNNARAEVRAGIALIGWLSDNGTTLADCTQRHIDRWLAENPARNRKVRAFLVWTHRNHHTGDVDVPDQLRGRGNRAAVEDDHGWALVRRLPHDDSVAVHDRVAGLLLLLFGQPLSKVSRLTRDQIVHDEKGTRITLGAEPLDLPSPLDDLVHQLADNRRGHAVVGHTDDHPWLFPGGAPGRPITAAHLMVRLHPFGIQARAARSTVLMDLAAELPPVVLSKLLGIHLTTATQWAHQAGVSNAAYTADLSRRKGALTIK